ncbi:TPA: VRR-NUC domain-containing protein [Yersinia enterocolitica]
MPNEGKRGPKAARDAKRLGLRKGVPDLFLALPRGGYAGLWVEMKVIGGKVTAEQQLWLLRLRNSSYRAEVCEGLDAVKKVLFQYL